MHDPIGGFERVRDLYLTYLETAFRIRDEGVSAERRALLETPGQLCTEPLVEPVPRYASSGLALEDLAGPAGISVLPGFSPEERTAFAELALAGLFDSVPADEGAPMERKATYPLYAHQAQMLERGVQEGHPGVVTSGTGSGKTESFLLPILASIAREATRWPAPESGYLEHPWWHDASGAPYGSWSKVPNRPGKTTPDSSPFRLHREGEAAGRPAAVRALVLYPMNALVEDQLTRVRKALDSPEAHRVMDRRFNGNRIFFGRYTSAAPVTGHEVHPRQRGAAEVQRRGRALEKLFDAVTAAERTQQAARRHDAETPSGTDPTRYLFPSTDGGELVSRWDMQRTPPDLLVTNVSMLNAMLMREVESPVFEATRAWLTQDPDAYFYLVLDELHLQRGSAGTEVAYLLRVLLDRLGLTDPAHRHKLRILASSASLPVDADPQRARSLQYLYDAFGQHGTHRRGELTAAEGQEAWADAVVPGDALTETPAGTHRLPTAPLLDLLGVYGGAERERRQHPDEHDAVWRAVADALRTDADEPLAVVAARAVAEAGARLGKACWSPADGRARAVTVSTLARRLVSDPNLPKNESVPSDDLLATRALLVLRGLGDDLQSWWPGEAKRLDQITAATSSFRVHTFFRAVEGLFAAPDEAACVAALFQSDARPVGPLSIERGERFSPRPDPDARGNRMLEVLYCECCGELFFGGRRNLVGGAVELLPYEPNLDDLPESARTELFEELSYDQYAVFWPSTRTPAERGKYEPDSGTWTRAFLDPAAGVVRPFLKGDAPGVEGRLFTRGEGYAERGKHKRGDDAPGTAVPFLCPFCGTNYGQRRPGMRLSPVRSFRAGFAKTTQLLATELFDLLRLDDADAKLLSFSDSRQEASRAALDIESGHHRDLSRDLLVAALRESAALGADDPAEIEAQMRAAATIDDFERASRLKARLDVAKARPPDDAVPLDHVVENDERRLFLSTGGNAREQLRPFLAGFVRLGIHPTDGAGVAPVEFTSGDEEHALHWAELFTGQGANVDWRDDPDRASTLDDARISLVKKVQRDLSDSLFARNYFSLEETGLGFPCLLGLEPGERPTSDAFLRVFTDAYRLRDNPWAKPGDDPPTPWDGEVPSRNRVHRFADALWGEADAPGHLAKLLKRFHDAGHRSGLVTTSRLGVRLVDEDAPFWRCSACSRAHLHQGVGRCTRCRAPLPDAPSGEARDLRARHYLAKRVDRTVPPFRLRCEELTGQTHDPADKQRRFRGVVLDVASGADVPASVERSLRKRASVVDLLTVTTTMEVGVDVGTLQATVQANMPPQRFNYQQRVGRAGRRRQAFSVVLTVCRNRNHDLYYFRHPEAITGDAPPPPFLSKDLPDPARRFVRKAWLGQAFALLRDDCAHAGLPFPGDDLSPPDVHGEFVPTDKYVAEAWRDHLGDALARTVAFKDALVATLTADSSLPTVDVDVTSQALLDEIDGVLDPKSSTHLEATAPGLGQTLAEAGLLPMLGMPTRVRDLYYAADVGENRFAPVEWRTSDRDLDVAIFEFSPGSLLINEKRQLECVGFTAPIPESARKGDDGGGTAFRPRADALSAPFWLVACDHCSGWRRLDGEPDFSAEVTCQTCGTPLDLAAAVQYRVPNGFRTDLEPRPIDLEARSPRRSGFGVVAEGLPLSFKTAGGDSAPLANLRCEFSGLARTYRVNAGTGEGFHVEGVSDARGPWGIWITGQAVAGDARQDRRYKREASGLTSDAVHLAAPKTTESVFLAPALTPPHLYLLPRKPDGSKNTAVRAAALSAAFLITYRAAKELDVDPDELEVVEPRIVRVGGDGPRVPALQITDQLVNGAGYCRQLAEPEDGVPRIVGLAQSIVADQGLSPLQELLAPGHPAACDQSCYRCLQRYGNQAYHGLLDWRLGLAYLQALLDPTYACGAQGFGDDPAGVGWVDLARRYATDLVRFDGLGLVRSVEGLVAFQVRPGGRWGVVVHPLWDPDDRPQIVRDACTALEDDGHSWRLVNTFDLARNALGVRLRLQ